MRARKREREEKKKTERERRWERRRRRRHHLPPVPFSSSVFLTSSPPEGKMENKYGNTNHKPSLNCCLLSYSKYVYVHRKNVKV